MVGRLSKRAGGLTYALDSPGVASLVSAANAAAIALLVHLLLHGVHAQAPLLLRAGIHMWCLNVLVFALWFWQLDSGGPAVRQAAPPEDRDFLFPQQAAPELTTSGWRPLFLDYLYLSFTNATAFSPTMPCRSAAGRRC